MSFITRRSFLAASSAGSALGSGAEDYRQVESEYLRRAAANIEQHRKGQVSLTVLGIDGRPVANAEVRVEQVSHEFLFGCIIFPLVSPRTPAAEAELYKRRFLEVFNLAVFPFYWASYENEPGRPRGRDLDPLLDWCAQNGVTAKGHPLVWTNPAGVPKWLSQFPEEMQETLLQARVLNTTAGFAGKIKIWDVVNEMIHTRTWKGREGGADPGTSEIADYVEKALRWAHAGDPTATLMLNEFDMASGADTFRKRDVPPPERFLRLIEELERRKAPRFEVGFQAHEPRQEWFSPKKLWQVCDDFDRRGYPIHMTEFIPQSSGKPITGGWRTGAWTEEAQAEFTDQFLRLSFGHPSVVSVNFWGLSDKAIWLPKGGLVDEQYNPKPAFARLRHLVRDEWTTKTPALRTAEDGAASFRGFYGKYRVCVQASAGKAHDLEIELKKGGQQAWTLRLPR